MKKIILLLIGVLSSLVAMAQTETVNNFPAPTRTVHWQTGTTPPGAFPIWTTRGVFYYQISTDTFNIYKQAALNETMNHKLLWVKMNGDVSAWIPNYVASTDTALMLSPYVRVADTVNRWAPKLPYLLSFTEVDPIWTSASINYYTKVQTDGLFVKFTDTSTMLAGYLRKIDTTAMLSGYQRKSTVRRVETYTGTTDASGNYTIVYSPAFSSTPDVQPQLQAGTTQQMVRITASSATGFTVNATNRATVTLLSVDVLLGNTTPLSGASVGVLVTSR